MGTGGGSSDWPTEHVTNEGGEVEVEGGGAGFHRGGGRAEGFCKNSIDFFVKTFDQFFLAGD